MSQYMCDIISSNSFYNSSKLFVNPIHVQPFNIPLIKFFFDNGKRLYITPKVDGIRSQIKRDGELYECEILKDHIYPYDCVNYINSESYYVRGKLLESLLNKSTKTNNKILHNIKSTNEIIKILDQNAHIEGNENLFFKPIFVIKKDIFDYSEMSNLLIMLSAEYLTLYPNDGWIMYIDDFSFPLKFKPHRHLTIDVGFNKINNVYSSGDGELLSNVIQSNKLNIEQNESTLRCYWDDNIKKWIASDIRHDKKVGNKIYIIKTIENMHINPINHASIWNKLVSNKLDTPYYLHSDKYKNTKLENNTLKYMKKLFFSSLFELLEKTKSSSYNLLDLGCGKGLLNNYLKDKKIKYLYTGIDIDPIILNHAYPEGIYKWENLNYTNIIGTYTHTFFVNSLHYVNNIKDMFVKLSKVTQYVIILGIFEDNYIKHINVDGITVTKDNENFIFSYPWKEDMFKEKILNKSTLIKDALESNWKLIQSINYNDENDFIRMHNILVFQFQGF